MVEAAVPHKKPLHVRIKKAREKRKLSQRELAELIGMTVYAVRKWERGEAEPNIEAHKRMATVLNVPLSRFNRF